MPLDPELLTLLESQQHQSDNRFKTGLFRTARTQWTDIMRRRFAVQFEEELKKFAYGIDLETPDVEYFFTEHVKILGIGSTNVTTLPLDESEEAKKDIEDIAVWKQAWLFALNEASNLTQSMSEAQVGLGIWVGRILWEMPGEFTWPDQDSDEDLPAYTARSLKAREKHYALSPHKEFRVTDVDPLQLSWGPNLSDPDVVFQDCEVPYWEYRNLKNSQGKYVSLDAAAKSIVWLGKPESHESSENLDTTGRKVHVVYRAMRAPGTSDWTLTTYVYPGGGDFLKDAELLDEVEVPAKMCPYVFVPSGEEQVRETDPHLRYRPKMYRSYTHAVDWNYLRSLIAVLARKEAGDHYLYIDPSYSLKPEMLPMLEELGLIDGVGSQRRMTYRQPDPGPGEIALSARYFRKPESPKEALFWLLEDTKESFNSTAPNRFLTGSAYEETQKGTGTAVVNQTQAAAFTYEGDLDEQAKGCRYILNFIDATILAWEEGNPTKRPYFLPVTESFMKDAPDPRTNVHITAEKLARHYTTSVNITNETQQEKLVRYEMADNDYMRGLISFEEYLRRRDVTNPKAKIRELNQERHRIQAAQEFREVEATARKTLYSALTGLNLVGMAAPPQAQPAPPMGGPGAGQMPMNGGQAPLARPIIAPDGLGGGSRVAGPGQ